MTRFLLDANISRRIAATLTDSLAIDIVSLQGLGLGELPDHLVVAYARRQQRVLISLDKDFESEDTGLFEHSFGVIRLKLTNSRDRRNHAIVELLADFLSNDARSIDLERSLVVVTPQSVTIVRTLRSDAPS